MTRTLLVLAALLLPVTAGAVDVYEARSKLEADVLYVLTPKAEADWLIYVSDRPTQRGRLYWFFTGRPCGSTGVKAVPKSQAQVKVHFVKRKAFARCKRKCDLLP